MPTHITPRLKVQQGVFTAQPDVTSELNISSLKKIIIVKESVKDIKWKLFTYGIGAKSIYPDIDGLCSQLRWSHFEEC